MFAIIQKITAYLVSLLISLFSILGCGCGDSEREDDIVVLYTNDVHCYTAENTMGYDGLAAYRNEMLESTPYVTLVDCGDSVQGGLVGSFSMGENIIDIMNYVGYSYSAIGNHEFDYGMAQLGKLIGRSDFKWLACNMTYSGDGESALENVAHYAIDDYDGTQVAYIGISTPFSVTSSTPAYFNDENGNRVYGFSEDSYFETIQENIDECRAKGADYVVILGHTGDEESYSPYSSKEIIENTEGIDVYLDGHAHNIIEEDVVENKNGEDVLLSSTGTGLVNIGKLTITADGELSTELISGYTEKDADTTAYIENIEKEYKESLGRKFSYNPVDFSIYTDGVRTIRSREMALGDLVADAYRESTGAEIAVANGGGIRNNLSSGDISYADIMNVSPFGNTVVAVKATGQQIVDALEFSTRFTQSTFCDESGKAVGESGGFFQVSGMKYTIDTSIPSGIVTDAYGSFVSVDGERRVKDVQVLNSDGTYSPIDLEKTYTLAGSDYTLFSCGDGFTMFDGCEKAISDGKHDYETVAAFFLEHTSYYISENYSAPQGRIIVK